MKTSKKSLQALKQQVLTKQDLKQVKGGAGATEYIILLILIA